MLFEDTYLTIAGPAEGVYRVSGSKFLSFALAVNNEGEIKPALQKIKLLHPAATHYCWAVRLGAYQAAHRFNDDGEPAGSAGRPIINTILSKNLNNVMVVVVRYFGGTLLGIPGLISAYKTATEYALKNAVITQKTFDDHYKITFQYQQMNAVMKIIKDAALEIQQQNFDTACTITVAIRKTYVDRILNGLQKLDKVNAVYLYSN